MDWDPPDHDENMSFRKYLKNLCAGTVHQGHADAAGQAGPVV